VQNAVEEESQSSGMAKSASNSTHFEVFLGAAAVTANGTVLSRTGTAAVAMVAHEWRMPVMICCETCKFQGKVQLGLYLL